MYGIIAWVLLLWLSAAGAIEFMQLLCLSLDKVFEKYFGEEVRLGSAAVVVVAQAPLHISDLILVWLMILVGAMIACP